MILKPILAISASVAVATCHAGLFSGPSAFYLAPQSQLGAITNGLVLTDNGTGFTVSGTVTVTTSPGADVGTLLLFDVRRPLDPAYGTGSLVTTTSVIGTSIPPLIGTFGNTHGVTETFFDSYAGASNSQVPLLLTAGVGAWSASVTSSPFVYNSTPSGQWLEQFFEIDGIQTSGPGGTWTISIPASSDVHPAPTPEPAPLAVFALGALGLVRRSRTRKSNPNA